MSLTDLSHAHWLIYSAVLGLCVGSFLNVIIHRLPIMMERAWEADLAQAQGQEASKQPRFDLISPRSHCPACKTPLRWWQNIPVISYIALRGKCAHCASPISMRYPVVEVLTAGLFLSVALMNPPGWNGLATMGFVACLLALAAIDLDTYLLPDDITLPLMWAGLMVNMTVGNVPLESAVLGAALGYTLLWAIYQLFKLATGKEGMGYGDFKLLAAMGAWLGAPALFSIILFSSVFGIFFGLVIQTVRGNKTTDAFPFGPSLVMGAFAWLAGFDLMKWL
jgi:leader peptidase (prepilin peptidase) / N-methyltransferase